MRPHRIAILSIHSSPLGPLGKSDTGGMSVCIRELARELGGRGHQVDIFTGRTTIGDPKALDGHEGVRLIHLDIGPRGKAPKERLHRWISAFARSLDDVLRREGAAYDLLHSHYWLSGAVAGKTRSLLGTPHLISFHTTALAKTARCAAEQEPTHRIDAERKLVRHCDRILAASAPEREALIHYYGAAPEKIGRVPWGVSCDHFRPIDQRAARRRLGLNEAETLVLFVGRITPVKGLAGLLAAMARLRHHRGLRLLVVGGEHAQGAIASRTGRLVGRLGLSDRVWFVGRVAHDTLPLWYSAADCLVLPSHDETFGLVGLESLACGTPVVAARVGAMETFLRDGRTGILVDDPSPPSLARALEKLLSSPEDQRLSPAAIAKSVSAHTWSAAATHLLEEYRAAAANKNEGSQPPRAREAAHLGRPRRGGARP